MTHPDRDTTIQLAKALKRWSDAAYRGDSNDDEHDAAHELASLVSELIGVPIDYSSGEE